MEIEWSNGALDDMASLDRSIARRVKKAVELFAETGAGDVKRLTAIDPPEFRLRIGNWRVRFYQSHEIMRVLRVRHRSKVYR